MAIILKTKPYAGDDGLVGKSHWWGAPDLPADVPYPCEKVNMDGDSWLEPLTFLCQIRLDEISTMVDEEIRAAAGNPKRLAMLNSIPPDGMLYIFAPLDYFLGELDSPLDYHVRPAVLYVKDLSRLRPYELNWEDSGESIFRAPEAIEFSREGDENDFPEGGIALFPELIHDEIAAAHPGGNCLFKLEENEDWGLRFYDCGTYYIYASGAADHLYASDAAKHIYAGGAADGGRLLWHKFHSAMVLDTAGDLFFY